MRHERNDSTTVSGNVAPALRPLFDRKTMGLQQSPSSAVKCGQVSRFFSPVILVVCLDMCVCLSAAVFGKGEYVCLPVFFFLLASPRTCWFHCRGFARLCQPSQIRLRFPLVDKVVCWAIRTISPSFLPCYATALSTNHSRGSRMRSQF